MPILLFHEPAPHAVRLRGSLHSSHGALREVLVRMWKVPFQFLPRIIHILYFFPLTSRILGDTVNGHGVNMALP